MFEMVPFLAFRSRLIGGFTVLIGAVPVRSLL
jgi:hypothetical protein